MTVNNTSSNAVNPAAVDAVAKPLSELTREQRKKVTSELLRIQNLMGSLEDDAHKDNRKDKSERGRKEI